MCADRTYLSLERHQLRVQVAERVHPGVLGGRHRHDVGLLQVHAFGGPAAGSERVMAVLSPDGLLLHRPSAAGERLVSVGVVGVLFHCLRSQRINRNIRNKVISDRRLKP